MSKEWGDGPLRFTVAMICDNAAFEDPEAEVARILRAIADRIEIEGGSGFYETIFDWNGNDVGRFRLSNRQD